MGKVDNRDKDAKPNLSVEYEIIVRDKNGKIIEHRREESKSLVKNFLLLLNAAFRISYSTVVDTSGTAQNASTKCHYGEWGNDKRLRKCYGGWAPSAGEGRDSFGIVIGTGDTPVTADDYNLESKIAHGIGAGQLYYYETVLYSPVIAETEITQEFRRAFRNGSGADITVKEIGLIVNIVCDNYKVMIIRDVITPLTIPDGATYTVKYFIKTSL